MNNRIKCKVKLSRQLFPKQGVKINNGEYAILSVAVEEIIDGSPKISKWGTITITGNMCAIDSNETYIIIADEVNNEKFGLQYELIYIGSDVDLVSNEDQRIFLSKILTETQVDSLFAVFEDPIKIIENADLESLCNVKGIKVKTALAIIEKYKNAKDYSNAYIALNDYGLTIKMINKLVDSYGSPDTVIARIKENPYLIADDVDGIGWSKADEIALKSGYEEYSSNRIAAFMKYYLNSQAMEGNSYVDIDDLLEEIDEVIGYDAPDENINEAFAYMAKTNMWHNDDKTAVGLKKYYELENEISNEIIRLIKSNSDFKYDKWKEEVAKQEIIQGWKYTEEQLNAIKLILENNVVLLSGSAGTGKTSTVAGVLASLKEYKFAQTALSGKASVNLTDVTGEEGYTIHRLLGYNPSQGFSMNKENQLAADIIILDELSMVDGELFYKLIQAIKNGSKLIMLGDTGQLESIGVANIMKDIIDSEVVPHAQLTQIHRQAAKSAIITESMNIRYSKQITEASEYGVDVRGEIKDLVLDIYKDKDSTFSKILNYSKKLIKEIDNIMDMQILVPMKNKGEACTYKINIAVQELLKNKNRGLKRKAKSMSLLENSKTPYTLYEGDKVINVKNNYKTIDVNGKTTPIFNGTLGIIKEVDIDNNTLVIDFQNIGEVIIPSNHLTFIELGYAITVHKSQGSGFKYIICGIDYSHYSLLNKEMVYTMITRAKQECILCAENSALRYAITQSSIKFKQTFLAELLKNKLNNINYKNLSEY